MGDGAMKQEAKLGTLYRGKKVVDHKDNKKQGEKHNFFKLLTAWF
jgi:hypothetical protein